MDGIFAVIHRRIYFSALMRNMICFAYIESADTIHHMYRSSYLLNWAGRRGHLDTNRNRAGMAFQAGRPSSVQPGNAGPFERDPGDRENQPRGRSRRLVLSACMESDREVVSLL